MIGMSSRHDNLYVLGVTSFNSPSFILWPNVNYFCWEPRITLFLNLESYSMHAFILGFSKSNIAKTYDTKNHNKYKSKDENLNFHKSNPI